MNQIGLLGGTGYTGRLVVKELLAQKIPFAVGIRNESKLYEVLDESSLNELKSNPDEYQVVSVDVTDEDSLKRFYEKIDTVISTVGPFCKLGKLPVVVANETKTNYIDSTGEPEFMKWIYNNFNPEQNFIVPACGFDYLPGDLISNKCLSDLDENEHASIEITYVISHWIPTRGTAESAIMAFVNSDDPGKIDEISFLDKNLSRLKIPWGEKTTVGLHHPNADVSCYVSVNKMVGEVLKFMTPLTRLAIPLLEKSTKFLPEGPNADRRRKATYDIYVKATAGSNSSYGIFNGIDIYGTTAIMLILSAQNASGIGTMAPSQAFDTLTMLKDISNFEVKSDDLKGATCNYSFVKP